MAKYKHVNAGIKSKKELAQRLIDGEEIYNKRGKLLCFDGNKQGLPFVVMCNNEKICMGSSWGNYDQMTVREEVSWVDGIADSVMVLPKAGVECNPWIAIKRGEDVYVVFAYGGSPAGVTYNKSSLFDNFYPASKGEVMRYVLDK